MSQNNKDKLPLNKPKYDSVTGVNATAVAVSRDTRDFLRSARDYVENKSGQSKVSINDIIWMFSTLVTPPKLWKEVVDDAEDIKSKIFLMQCQSLSEFIYNEYFKK